eukprot:COSAG01_NODE_1065_length_11883_cov_104.177868_1_plen_98_part_00
MEYMSRKKDQNGISHPRMTLTGILKFDEGTKSEYSDPTWNIWGSKALIGISPLFYWLIILLRGHFPWLCPTHPPGWVAVRIPIYRVFYIVYSGSMRE